MSISRGTASSSKLRQLRAPITADDDFDMPDSFPAPEYRVRDLGQPRSRTTTNESSSSVASSSRAPRNLHSEITAYGANGATIQRLVPKKKPGEYNSDTIRMKAGAMDGGFEDDIDFGGLTLSKGGKFASLQKRARAERQEQPGPDALDDLDFDDDNGATLRAGDTIKAKLPPKKGFTTIPPPFAPAASSSKVPMMPEEDDEEGFAISLEPTKLSKKISRGSFASRPTHSAASGSIDWDSPTTSTSGKRSTWESSSKAFSETSGTSLTDGSAGSPVIKGRKDAVVAIAEEEDMEDGFASLDAEALQPKRLNERLREKRLGNHAPTHFTTQHQRVGTDETNRTADESMEEGFQLDSLAKLPKSRAGRSRRAIPLTKKTQTQALREKEGMAEPRTSDTGKGRVTPMQQLLWDRGAPSGSGMRSQSATTPKDGHRPGTPRELTNRPRPSLSGIQGDGPSSSKHYASQPSARAPQTPSSRRLRPQASQANLQAQHTPAISRKQSLQDLSAHPTASPPSQTPPPSRSYHSTSSRMNEPRNSVKGKVRPPLPFTKSDLHASSSTSSISTSDSIVTPYDRSSHNRNVGQNSKLHRSARKEGSFGDGFELETIPDSGAEAGSEGMGPNSFGMGRPGYDQPTKSSLARMEHGQARKQSASGEHNAQNTGSWGRNKTKGLYKLEHPRVRHAAQIALDQGMRWNDKKRTWEGNEDDNVLADFPSEIKAKMAFISHARVHDRAGSSTYDPIVKVSGDMQFDPVRMCWVSTLPPEEEEPDPFEGLADDEDEEKGGTIRASGIRKLQSAGSSSGFGASTSSHWSARQASEIAFSTQSSLVTADDVDWRNSEYVSKELVQECQDAKARHRAEMSYWFPAIPDNESEQARHARVEQERERVLESLWTIRDIARGVER